MTRKISAEKLVPQRTPRRNRRQAKLLNGLSGQQLHRSSPTDCYVERTFASFLGQRLRGLHLEKLTYAVRIQCGLLRRVLRWLRATNTQPKRLRVAETVSLGDKRFIAIIHVDGNRYLIGGGTSGVSLLKQLSQEPVPRGDVGALVDLSESRV